MRALIFGQNTELMNAVPSLMHRSGFDVDVIITNNCLQKNRFISNYEIIPDLNNFSKRLNEINLDIYEFIIPCSDEALKLILDSSLSLEKKLKILPVTNIENFEHLYSKIGLSKVLSRANILTPTFAAASNYLEAKERANEIGFPLLIKVDSSNGGSGVIECENLADINKINELKLTFPLLIQKKINGIDLDLSAIYRDGNLLHFSYSEVKEVISSKFGPSVLRIYKQTALCQEDLFLEMKKLGRFLGANGFSNIGAIKSNDDGKIYFIECDMRPNVWIEFSKFIGDDPAIKIRKWFLNKEAITAPQKINPKYPPTLLLPYFFRMLPKDILTNRHMVWKYMSRDDFRLFAIKQFLPLGRKINRIPTNLIRLVLPNKEVRIAIKKNIKKIFPSSKAKYLNPFFILNKVVGKQGRFR